MKKSYLYLSMALTLIILLASCRDPSLEQAIIDYKGSRWDQAYESIQKAVEKVPGDPEAWYYFGEIAGKKNDIDKMVDAFGKSLALKNTFASQIGNAKNFYFSKFYNGAVQSYNTYNKIEDKESDDAKKILNNIAKDFKNALIIENDYQANRLIANTYMNLQDDENHLKYLMHASESKPDTALAWLEIGLYYRNKKEYVKASEYLKKTIELDPQNKNALTLYPECLDFSGKKDEAMAAYKNAAEANPQEKAIPFNLGLLLYKEANKETLDPETRKKYLTEAEIYFKKVYDLDPEFREIYDLYGPVLIYNENYDVAKQVLLEGTKYFPDAAVIWGNLSIVYARTGESKKANEADKRSRELSKETL